MMMTTTTTTKRSRRKFNEMTIAVVLVLASAAVCCLGIFVVDASTVAVPPLLTTTAAEQRQQQYRNAVFPVVSSWSSPSSSSSAVKAYDDGGVSHDDDDQKVLVVDASSTATAPSPPSSSSSEEDEEAQETAATLSSTKSSSGGGGNPVVQIVVSMKDEIMRYIYGTKELYTNHQRCNRIRVKQKDYREKLRKQWEFEESDLTPKDLKARLAKVNGGITYDEFLFLVKGKDDRSKLLNLFFLMWGAPRVLPYAIIFYQGFLPSPLQKPDLTTKESKLEKYSRQRSHAVLKMLMNLEDEAKQTSLLAGINPFGKKAQQRKMDETDSLTKTMGQIISTTPYHRPPDSSSSSSSSSSSKDWDVYGARLTMNTMDALLYKNETFSRADQRLVGVPKTITTCLMNAVGDGPSPFAIVMPNFLKRGQLLTHVQKLTDLDNFLVDEDVDLKDLSTVNLIEACNDRCIGGPGRKEEELRQQLSDWLDFTVRDPAIRCQKSGEYHNENLGRAALLGYYATCGARDRRSSSFLPRMMYEGSSKKDDHSNSDRKNSLKLTW